MSNCFYWAKKEGHSVIICSEHPILVTKLW